MVPRIFAIFVYLTGRIKESAPSRIVNVSAMGHKWAKIDLDDINMEKGSRDTVVYCNSKLCNIITANEIGRRLKGTGKYIAYCNLCIIYQII